jgi:hypothetical protein
MKCANWVISQTEGSTWMAAVMPEKPLTLTISCVTNCKVISPESALLSYKISCYTSTAFCSAEVTADAVVFPLCCSAENKQREHVLEL